MLCTAKKRHHIPAKLHGTLQTSIHPRNDEIMKISWHSRCNHTFQFSFHDLLRSNMLWHLNNVLFLHLGAVFPLTKPSKLCVYIYIHTYPNLPFRDYIPLRKETKFPRSGRMISGSLVQLFACVDVSVTSWVLKTTKKGWSFWDVFWERLWGEWNKKQMKIPELFLLLENLQKVWEEIEDFGILTDMFLKFHCFLLINLDPFHTSWGSGACSFRWFSVSNRTLKHMPGKRTYVLIIRCPSISNLFLFLLEVPQQEICWA